MKLRSQFLSLPTLLACGLLISTGCGGRSAGDERASGAELGGDLSDNDAGSDESSSDESGAAESGGDSSDESAPGASATAASGSMGGLTASDDDTPTTGVVAGGSSGGTASGADDQISVGGSGGAGNGGSGGTTAEPTPGAAGLSTGSGGAGSGGTGNNDTGSGGTSSGGSFSGAGGAGSGGAGGTGNNDGANATGSGAAPSGGQGGAPSGGQGGASSTGSAADCVVCDEGFECFADVDPERCFEICTTDEANVALRTQEEVTNLAALGCEVIAGHLVAVGEAIESLAELTQLRVVKGALSVQDTTRLEDLSGLDGLLLLGGGITASNNAALKSIAALANASSAGNITLHDNIALESLDGLQGFVHPSGLLFTNNFALADISALSPETVGSVLLSGNQAIPLIRFERLRAIDEDLGVMSESACTALELPLLESVGNVINIAGNAAMLSIDFGSLSRAGSLSITGNESLTSVGGLPNLESSSTLTIASNASYPQCEAEAITARLGCTCEYEADETETPINCACVENSAAAICE